ncbi:MAG: ABC transporter substrate-binding protein [Trueperaceae bacterium]|nr:ABC transporter substrate-binding protein [Trueperaceae bacterium]
MAKLYRAVLTTLLVTLAATALAAGTLRLAITQDEGTLTPYTYQTGYPGYELMALIYDQLFLLDTELIPQPWLAESLEIDGLDYNIVLREGLRWHDGEPITADDVAFSIGYYKTHVLGRFTTNANKVASVQVHDERSLTITLSAPDAVYVQIALADLPMLPEHIWSSIDEPRQATADKTIGSGPYKLAEYRTDQFYRLVANTDYWGPAPTFDTIIAPVIRDETATFQALLAGEIDVASRVVPAGVVSTFSSRNDIELAQGAGFASTILIMDITQPGLNDVEVRRVIAGSIDYDQLIDIVLLGYGTAGVPGFLHPATPFANPATGEHQRITADEAASRLEAAGWTRGADGVYANSAGDRLDFEFLAPSNNPTRLRAAELIAQSLNAAGVRVTVRAMEADALTELAWPGFDVSAGRNYQIAIFGWSAPVNAQANLRGLLHGDPAKGTLNLSGYANEEADGLVDAAAVTTDEAERRALLYAAQERLAADLPLIPVFYQDGIYAYRPAAYSGWTFMAGQGIIHKGSFVSR